MALSTSSEFFATVGRLLVDNRLNTSLLGSSALNQGETPCESNEVTATLLCSLSFMRQDYRTIEVYEHMIDTKDE